MSFDAHICPSGYEDGQEVNKWGYLYKAYGIHQLIIANVLGTNFKNRTDRDKLTTNFLAPSFDITIDRAVIVDIIETLNFVLDDLKVTPSPFEYVFDDLLVEIWPRKWHDAFTDEEREHESVADYWWQTTTLREIKNELVRVLVQYPNVDEFQYFGTW